MRTWMGMVLAGCCALAGCGRSFEESELGRTVGPSEVAADTRPAEMPIDWAALERMREFQGLLEMKSLPAAKDGWHRLGINVVVSEQCTRDFGSSSMVDTIRGGIAGGMSCLAGLGGVGSMRLLREMRILFGDARNPVKISCSRKDPFGPRTLAIATVPGDDGHPNIALNPAELGKKKVEERQSTLFHELFHNLGYMHYVGVEYAYACQVCCFRGSSPEAQDAACKVCRTDYESVYSPKYVREATDFLDKMYRREHAAQVVDRFLKKYPTSREFSVSFAYRFRFVAPAFAYGLAQGIDKRFKDFTDEEERQLDAAKAVPSLPKQHLVGGRLLGEAYWFLIRNEMDEVITQLGAFDRLKIEAKGTVEERESAEGLEHLHLDIAWYAYFHFQKLQNAATKVEDKERLEERVHSIYERFLKGRKKRL